MKKVMKKMLIAGMACVCGAALLAGCGGDSGSKSGGEKQFLNIATGGTAGTYYPLGGALAELLNNNIKGMNASAQSTGASVANVNMLKDGSVDLAFIQNDIAYYAVNGSEMFKDNKVAGLRGLAALYPETIQFVTTADKGIKSIADLKGRTIYAGGKGATPEYALNYILEKNGLVPGEDVTIEWKSEHAECVAALAEDADGIAMLPQPFVTTAQTKKETLRTALDLTEEWNKIQESEGTVSTLVTGVTVVRTAFAKEHPEAVADFLEAYQASVSYVTENTDEAAKLIGDYDIVPEAVAKKALPACNIVCITGDEMKEKLSGYLGVLKDQNPEAVGGELPGDDFYYSE